VQNVGRRRCAVTPMSVELWTLCTHNSFQMARASSGVGRQPTEPVTDLGDRRVESDSDALARRTLRSPS